MRRILLLAFLMPTIALAQQPDVTLKVTPVELGQLGQALDAKVNETNLLINKLRQQYIEQQPKGEPQKPPVVDAPK